MLPPMRMTGAVAGGLMFAALVVGIASVDPLQPPAALAQDSLEFETLMARLLGDDPKEAAAASDTLVAKGAAVVPRLSVTSGPLAERVVMLETLGRIAANHDEAMKPLLAALADKEPDVRSAAARGLALAGARAKAAQAELAAAMRDESAEVRIEAAAATHRLGASAPVWNLLLAATKDKSPALRARAVAAVARAGAPSGTVTPLLLGALKDADASVRIAAIRALAASGAKGDDVATAIASCARSADPGERAAALAALPKISDTPVGDLLRIGGAFRGDRVRRKQLASAGGSPQTEAAVAAALDWLARHQSEDGSWGSGAFASRCREGKCTGGTPFEGFSPGIAGLALLAFLGAGETSASGPHRETVQRGLAFLRGAMDSEGCIGSRKDHYFLYGHAVATIALCEASMLTDDAATTEAADRAVEFALKTKNPYLAWRYNYPPDGDNDTSLTGWMTYALAVGRAAGIRADDAKKAIGDAGNWVDKMTEPEFGRTGYQQRGGPSSRMETAGPKFPVDKVEPLTSIGVMVRVFAGAQKKDDELIDKGGALLAKKPPRWDIDAGTIDFVYWFWGSLAARQIGGTTWRPWNEALKQSLLPNQDRSGGCSRGSWPAVDAWSDAAGRVYATAMCCLSLETYYRMDRMLEGK
jgi:hypothetical protein